MTISELNVPLENLGGRRGALRSVSANVAAVRRHMDARLWTVHQTSPVPVTDVSTGSAGARDLLLAPIGESDNVLQRTLRTLGVVQQRSLADYLG